MSQSRKAIWQRALAILAVLLVVQLFLVPAVGASGCPFYYLVRPGDTLTSIAIRFGTTVSAIARANGIINPNCIFAGRCLLIPCPTVVRCPSACQVNPCASLCPTTCRVTCPRVSGCIHVVQFGETLTGIAARFGTSVFTLMRLNGISNPNCIFAGQRLRVC